MKRLILWFADLWPADCIYCIYLRFLILGFTLAVALIASLLTWLLFGGYVCR